MLLEKFTVKMFLKSAFGDNDRAIELANKCADKYRPFVKQNKIARNRYISAITCSFILGLK